MIDLFGVIDRERYELWSVDTDGGWNEIATWAWSEDGTCGVVDSTHLVRGDIARLVITGAGDKSDAVAWGTRD